MTQTNQTNKTVSDTLVLEKQKILDAIGLECKYEKENCLIRRWEGSEDTDFSLRIFQTENQILQAFSMGSSIETDMALIHMRMEMCTLGTLKKTKEINMECISGQQKKKTEVKMMKCTMGSGKKM